MRAILLLFAILPFSTEACTAFKVTQDGRTLIGCNEDAWSINAQVRFEQGRNGQFGAIYFGHSNGSPFRSMADQMGMNEAGLVFDGLVLAPQAARKTHGGRQVRFDELMPMVLRSCADVEEAADLLRTIDLGWLNTAMIFLADRNGETLIVEADTMLFSNDPALAISNWRMSSCTDPNAIPIPRLKAGRQLLMNGNGASLDEAQKVLSIMSVCRKKMGEGTLFSVLFDPAEGQAHLYFYHDFSARVTFDMKEELAKGDRTIDMASLFGARPEYAALLAYKTPFHQRWLWWSVVGIGIFSLLVILWAAAMFVMQIVITIRSRSFRMHAPWLALGLSGGLAIFLCALLLMNEGAYYFGLGVVVQRIHPTLGWSPMALALSTLLLLAGSYRHARHRHVKRAIVVVHGALLSGLMYWGLMWP